MRLALLFWLLLLAGCQKSFDDKYADAEKQLKADAKQLDDEMADEAKKEPDEEK